ncbi:hypothetical protein BABINDRAFT_158867 [Babjeviella inositovora NRRL Y-12698]|uniref:Transcription factor CBF/NF-Y/archaeal histone domain-containing protein n=1 Tax=Babjeviella inositovora NRRL Y-12698 TaxID=984486 RepID=A0A1E3QYR0_9ASCO|nr:uncharacterized protein BABINDRAFT_158867 [Babjeviella inositovora NRRL Y-12698]ODQ82227.1 hypothetical protein BABINDRAFT_158867 [Babjeviella inositovora NRRL Y-12698]
MSETEHIQQTLENDTHAEKPHLDEDEEDVSGTISLPVSRIKKILKCDPMYVSSSNTAVFSTAVATELFIQYFTEQASLIARADKRKKVQYKDFATAVQSIEQLHFLSDTVPKTAPLSLLIAEHRVSLPKGTVSEGVPEEVEEEEEEYNEEEEAPEVEEKPVLAKKVYSLPKGQQTLSFFTHPAEPLKEEPVQTNEEPAHANGESVIEVIEVESEPVADEDVVME